MCSAPSARTAGPKPYYTKVRLAITPSIQTQQVRLKGGAFAAMLNGYPTSNRDQARKDPNLKVSEFPSQQTLIAYVNTHRRPFDGPAARAAVAKVLDLKSIVSQAYGDTAVVPVGPYPPAVLSRQPKLDYGQSAPAGAPATGKGQTVRIAYPAHEVAALSRVSQLLQTRMRSPLSTASSISACMSRSRWASSGEAGSGSSGLIVVRPGIGRSFCAPARPAALDRWRNLRLPIGTRWPQTRCARAVNLVAC